MDDDQINLKLQMVLAAQSEAANLALATQGQVQVLSAAVVALLETHPDHAAFAKALRRAWLAAGSQHSNAELPKAFLDAVAGQLSILEEYCEIPLGVRPLQG